MNLLSKYYEDLNPNAKKYINSLPYTFINLFRKKRRVFSLWSIHKYCVVIKSSFLVYFRAGKHNEGDEKNYRYIDLHNCEIKIVDDDSVGYVFTIVSENGKVTATFAADNEKDRAKFIQQVHLLQRLPPTTEDFQTLCLIGKGHYGRVILAKGKDNSSELYAVKEMKIGQTKQKIIHNERMIMEWISYHPFILGLDYAFTKGKAVFLITKFMAGGDLFLNMQKQGGCFSEEEVKFYAAELVIALEHLHSLQIVHRDIKPENVLLDHDGHIKLADMGLAKKLEEVNSTTKTMCGTDEYLPPEMVCRNSPGHGLPVDMWQLGCLLYELRVGHPPFYSPPSSKRQTYQRILYQVPKFPSDMSVELKSLITGLLTKSPSQRLGTLKGVVDVKEHSYFKGTNWADVYQKKYKAPFVPSPSGEKHVKNFDRQFTEQSHQIDISRSNTPRDFAGFDFIHPDSKEFNRGANPADEIGHKLSNVTLIV